MISKGFVSATALKWSLLECIQRDLVTNPDGTISRLKQIIFLLFNIGETLITISDRNWVTYMSCYLILAWGFTFDESLSSQLSWHYVSMCMSQKKLFNKPRPVMAGSRYDLIFISACLGKTACSNYESWKIYKNKLSHRGFATLHNPLKAF